MRCRPRALLPAPPVAPLGTDHHRHELATCTQTWRGGARPPPSLADAVDVLPTGIDELMATPPAQESLEHHVHALTAALAQKHNALLALREHVELRGRALHHRVKNDLQVIASLLDWHGQDLEDPHAKAVFEECQGRVHAIALVHELLYRAGDLERLDLGQYLGRLACQMFEAYGIDQTRIHLTLQADAISVAADTAIPCGLLVHEVLVNCLKHAFPAPHKGAVAITLRATPAGQVTLSVRDTGIGWPREGECGATAGFGLHLIHGLTEQLQGTLTFMHVGGTDVTLRFPI